MGGKIAVHHDLIIDLSNLIPPQYLDNKIIFVTVIWYFANKLPVFEKK